MQKGMSYIMLLLILMTACGEKPEKKEPEKQPWEDNPNKKVNFYSSGEVSDIITIDDDGVRHGKSVRYYKSGAPNSVFPYTDGSIEGQVKWYYETGELYKSTPYKNNVANGLARTYYRNGKVSAEIPYKNGYTGKSIREFTKEGKLLKDRPKLFTDWEMDDEKTVTVWLWVDDYYSNGATFYVGELEDGEYLNSGLTELEKNEDGKAFFTTDYDPVYQNLEITYPVIVKVRTHHRNYWLDVAEVTVNFDY